MKNFRVVKKHYFGKRVTLSVYILHFDYKESYKF